MEELWTKYGDTMEKPSCLGVLYRGFPSFLWRVLNEYRSEFQKRLADELRWIKLFLKKYKIMKVVLKSKCKDN
jgi:hypothetical protein